MAWFSTVAFLMISMPPMSPLEPQRLDRIREFLSLKPECANRLAALDFVLKTEPSAKAHMGMSGYKIDHSVINLVREQRAALVQEIASPRLHRELALAIWRAIIHEAEIQSRILKNLREKSNGNAVNSFVNEWLDSLADRERRINEATLHALFIQTELNPDGKKDPVFSLQHASGVEQGWVWNFDRERESSGKFFEEKAAALLKPVSLQGRTFKSGALPLSQEFRHEILEWFDSKPLIGDLADDMRLRDLSPDYRTRFIRFVKDVGVPEHPFSQIVLQRDRSMREFLEGKELSPKVFIDTESIRKSLVRGDFEKAWSLYREGEVYAKEREHDSDYFELEPVIMTAIRQVLVSALSHDQIFAFEPRKKSRDGDMVIAFAGFQIRVFLNANKTIKYIKIDFLTETEVSYLMKQEKASPQEFVNVPAPVSASPDSKTELIKPKAPEVERPPMVPLMFEGLDLPSAVQSEFNHLNEEYPGHHEFLEAAALLLYSNPEFMETRGLGWFFSKVQKRLRLDGIAGAAAAVESLEHDIDRYQDARRQFEESLKTKKTDAVVAVQMPPAPIPQNISADDVHRILKEWGWSNGRYNGDHAIFTYPGARRNIVLSTNHTNGLQAAARWKLKMAWQYQWEADQRRKQKQN